MKVFERDSSGTIVKVTNAAKLVSVLIGISAALLGGWIAFDDKFIDKAEADDKYCSIEKANEIEIVLAGSLKSFQIGQYQQRLKEIDRDKRYWQRVLRKDPHDHEAQEAINGLEEEKQDLKRYLDKLLGRG